MTSEYTTCSSAHPIQRVSMLWITCVSVFFNTSSFVTQSVYLIFQILFTQVVGKHQFVHYPGLTGVESCSVGKTTYLKIVPDLSDFIHTGCWKEFVHYPGLTGVESCRKDHIPQDRTFSKFWHLLQDWRPHRLHYHDSSSSFMTQEFVYVSICLWIALAFCLWFDLVLNKQQISTPTLGAFASWVIIVNSSKLEYIHVLI